MARQAREALMAAPIPPTIANAVVEAYTRLGNKVPVAVRSSATAEDLPHARLVLREEKARRQVMTGFKCLSLHHTGRFVDFKGTYLRTDTTW